MRSAPIWQYLLIALALTWSLAYVVQRQFPAAARRWRGRCAIWLLRKRRPGWLHRLGRRLAPAPTVVGAGCAGQGCDGCDKR